MYAMYVFFYHNFPWPVVKTYTRHMWNTEAFDEPPIFEAKIADINADFP